MANTDYTHTLNQALAGGSTTLLRWAYALAVLSGLKNDPVAPYVTKGSSRNGTLGAAFSATPDGVDYWTGKSQTEVAGAGNPIWHVLENTKTGHQVCFLLGTSSGPVSTFVVVFALNKFETGGAWRGGGTGTATRPTDVTSSPTAARELNTAAVGFTPQSTSNNFYNISVRKDGRGFYVSTFRDTTPNVTADGNFMGYYPLTTPDSADVNPYLAFVANNTGMSNTTGIVLGSGASASHVGRLQDGTLQEHTPMNLDQASVFLDRLNPWKNAYPMHGIALRSNTTKDIRLWMPDVFIVSGPTPASSDFATRNSKKYFRLGPNAGASTFTIVIPWDGTTTRGTDIPTFIFPESATDGPSIVNADFKIFNIGLEKI